MVVHPKHRTIGLGSKLVRDTLELASTEYVEMSAVIAKYNPFAEKAGMKKIVEQQPPKEALYITNILQQQGFNLQLLGSERYVLSRLQVLGDGDILKIREVFVRNRHTRFTKSLSCHLPFGTRDAYTEEILNADLKKLSSLIRICGFLMQTKVYLFWKKENWE